MDPERCQYQPGGLLKLWHQSGISVLRLSSIKIALFCEKSRCDFSQNRDFSFFPESSLFFHYFGEILVPNGSRAVPNGGWRCCKCFGTILGSVFFDFPPSKSNSLRKTKGPILSKWRFSVIFRVISFPLFGRNSGTKWIKIGAKRSMEVL